MVFSEVFAGLTSVGGNTGSAVTEQSDGMDKTAATDSSVVVEREPVTVFFSG